eukprot:gene2285-2596_t
MQNEDLLYDSMPDAVFSSSSVTRLLLMRWSLDAYFLYHGLHARSARTADVALREADQQQQQQSFVCVHYHKELMQALGVSEAIVPAQALNTNGVNFDHRLALVDSTCRGFGGSGGGGGSCSDICHRECQPCIWISFEIAH